MRALNPALTAHLQTGATTLCHCWKVVKSVGAPMGFTDHDEPLSFDSVTYEAASGFEASAIEAGLGLSVVNQDITGALSSGAITESDLAAGRFDNASVEIWRVNWADVAQRVLLVKGEIGEVRRTATGFTAELRGLSHRLNQPAGRAYQFSCDADLGDARCTVNLVAAAFHGTGAVVTATDQRVFSSSGLSAFADGWFVNGRLTWTSGLNVDLGQTVKAFAGGEMNLWEPMPFAIQIGDTFMVSAGCDKRFATYRTKFNNRLNFRGSPLMPGNDWVMAVPREGEDNSGGSLTQ